ncbi:NBS-LRR type disease resistance protein [Quillaja saponaria]|uniref:NBS-LRR type disease resistance protein n=1 Tax=Quillaja saponaria TaxID=32244 RepID=A0AAD7LQP0_QUISA|nr:NBS-LRR type disease resistance protein [Quillaja saponaria]
MQKLTLHYKDAKWILDNKYPIDLFHNLKEFQLRECKDDQFPYWFIHRMPNLENLFLRDSLFEDVFIGGRNAAGSATHQLSQTGTVVQLKKLWLFHMPKLKIVCRKTLDPVLQMLEYLSIGYCPSLLLLIPSSLSFTHLKTLEIVSCDNLRLLVVSSTAKGLVQLTSMKISKCQMIEQVTMEKMKEKNERDQDEIVVFSQLKTLELLYLPALEHFCSGGHCVFKFPLLEKLLVKQCPKMKTFSQGVVSTPKLDFVITEDEGKGYWAGDLNATIQKLQSFEMALSIMMRTLLARQDGGEEKEKEEDVKALED